MPFENTVKKLGICVQNLGPSQKNFYLVKRINQYINDCKYSNFDIIVFYNDVVPIAFKPLCGTMHIAEAFNYQNSTMIATCLETAQKVSKMMGPIRKIFYPYNLEWVRQRNQHPLPYELIREIYGNKSLELYVRSKDHADILKNNFNRQSITMGEFEINKFLE